MERMQASQPVFIRCIKPNEKKTPQLFDDKHVNAQVSEGVSHTKVIWVVFTQMPY